MLVSPAADELPANLSGLLVPGAERKQPRQDDCHLAHPPGEAKTYLSLQDEIVLGPDTDLASASGSPQPLHEGVAPLAGRPYDADDPRAVEAVNAGYVDGGG